MDETLIGGKPRGREIRAMARRGLGPMQAGQAAARAKRSTVFGMVERGGNVAAHVVPLRVQGAAFGHVESRVLPSSIIYTDRASETDATVGGGKPRGREIRARARRGLGPMQAGQAAARAKRSTAFGMVERGGNVAAHVVPLRFQGAAFGHVESRVLPSSIIY